jgi:hypothetical protein
MNIRIERIIGAGRATRIVLIFVLLLSVGFPHLGIFEAQASQLTPLSDTLTPGIEVATSSMGLSNPQSVAVSGNYAYVASKGNSSLVVFNISNPSSPTKVGSSTNGLCWPISVAVSGNYAYVIDNCGRNLIVFDISIPSSPTKVGSSSTGLSDPHSVTASGNYAYIADYANGLVVFDVSTPSLPTKVGSSTTGLNGASDVTVSANYAYVASMNNSSLVVFNVLTPSNPTEIGSSNAAGSGTRSVAVAGSYAYVASYSANALSVFDISTPSNPTRVGSSTTGLSDPLSVAVSGNYAYVASQMNSSLVEFNVSTPSNPTEVAVSNTGLSGAVSVAVSGNYAYVASGTNNSLVIFGVPLSSDTNADGTGTTSVAHTLALVASTSVAAGKTYIVYLQCNSATSAAGFNSVNAGAVLITDGSTTIYSGAGAVGSCASGNVSTFGSTSFIPVTSGAITSSVNTGDTITISGITATNPNVAATASAPFIVDVQDSNSPADEGFAAIPISSTNQLNYNVAVPPWITLGLSTVSTNLGNVVVGINTASTQPVLTTSCNAPAGESVYVYDSGKPSDTTGAVGGLWTVNSSHKIPSVANTGSGTTLTTSVEGYGINGGTGSSTSGTFTVQAPYNSGTSTVVGGLLKNWSTLFAQSPGPVSGTSTLKISSSVITSTPPGLYTDSNTFVAVGAF